MSENKFIEKLKGQGTAKSVLEVKNQNVHTSFGNMPKGTSNANDVYVDHSGDAVGVLQGAQNWKISGSTLVLSDIINGDGQDYSGETDKNGGSVVVDGDGMAVSGAGLWVDASYTFTGDPLKPVAIFNKNTKWVLKLCGDRLSSDNETIDLTVLVKIGTNSVISKIFTVKRNAFQFCEDLVIDFSESNSSTVKIFNNQTLRLQVICSDSTASATIYNGMSVLSALQIRVNFDTVSSDSYNLETIEEELDKKVNKDGTSVMTGPLKMADGSMRGAFSPYLNGVGFWKMDAQEVLTQIATLSDTQFLPATSDAISFGSAARKWKDLYLSGTEYLDNGKGIRFAGTASSNYFNILTNQDELRIAHKYGSYDASLSFRAYIGDVVIYPHNDNRAIFGLPTRRWNRIYAANLCSDTSGNNVLTIPNEKSGVLALVSEIGRTNCITEIPQDINLTLSNGTLTLKAGSKFYLPNGVGVFDVYTSSNDHSTTNSNDGVRVVFTDSVGNLDSGYPLNRIGSGATLPANNNDYSVFYNTTDGKIYTWQTDQFKVRPMSLPIAIITISGGQITSIDQVFNGFGYIGSTAFALPGIKYLLSDGRNADGTLKNISLTTSSVSTGGVSYSSSGLVVVLSNNGNIGVAPGLTYDEETNRVYSSGVALARCIVGSAITTTGGVITSLDAKTPFHAVDYNDAVNISQDQYIYGIKTFRTTIIRKFSNHPDGSNHYNVALAMMDDQGTVHGYLRNQLAASGDSSIDLQARKTISDTDYYISMGVGFRADNSVFSYAPTPHFTSNDSNIATTSFVRKVVPAGVMLPYAGTAVPDGYLLCDGSAVSRTTYADLFAAIGTTYGSGDGTTTFNLPNNSQPVIGKSNLGVSVSRTTDVGVSSSIASNGAMTLTASGVDAHLRWYASGNQDGARLWDTGLYSNGDRTNASYKSGLQVSNTITQPVVSGSLSNTFQIQKFIIKY